MAEKRAKKPSAKKPAGTAKAWGGRFAADLAPLAAAYNASLPFDRRLWDADLRGSEAHARMLGETGILTKAEARAILGGLAKIRKEIEVGTFPWREAFEDVHLNVEKRLIELVGPVGGKLHTARSRNDQVATDLRLYLRDRAAELDIDLRALQAVLVNLADAHREAIMPGYTHLQRAQPVLFAHHLLAYFEMFGRDRARFADAARRMNECPLGAGALAGTPFPIDRAMTARDLGFERPMANSMDAVASRDFALEFLAAAAIAATHLARFAEELILWSSAEWGFVEIDDAFATGSSIMPQKKNADMAELARGKAGRVVGALVSLLVTVKGLPLAYNKDLQEDKEPVFDAADTLHVGLRVFAGMLATITVHPDRMLRATEHGYLTATDLADYLAAKGMPFREAHGVVGRLVARAIRRGVALHELGLDEMREESERIEGDVYPVLDVRRSVESRRSLGGTAAREVARQIRRARRALARP